MRKVRLRRKNWGFPDQIAHLSIPCIEMRRQNHRLYVLPVLSVHLPLACAVRPLRPARRNRAMIEIDVLLLTLRSTNFTLYSSVELNNRASRSRFNAILMSGM
ncbi:uncharacterized [Tachysurus ichikawai]